MGLIRVLLVLSGALLWAWILFGIAYSLFARPRVRRWLEQPSRYAYSKLVAYRVKGFLIAAYRRMSTRTGLSPDVDRAMRSVRLADMKSLRDALLEVDRLPTVEKGKAVLGVSSVFELPARGVHRIPSPYTHPLQYPPFFLPGVPAQTFPDPRQFEWVKPLEDAYPVIKAELLKVLREDAAGFQAYLTEVNSRIAGWNTFNFFFYGRKFEENCARCPETTRVLESLPRFEKDHVMFSALNPGAHITPHTGPMNGIVRGHLALIAPPGCYIRVGSDQRTWEEGKVLTFDDSFEHEVWNHSASVRIVLFMNFWHPCFSREEIQVLERFRRAYELSPLSRVHEENQAQKRSHDVALPG